MRLLKKKLLLLLDYAPGDTVVLTAAVRDLRKVLPSDIRLAVSTTGQTLWNHNPNVEVSREISLHDKDTQVLRVHYTDLLGRVRDHSSPYHLLHGMVQYLEKQLDIKIPITAFKGDIYLSDDEQNKSPLGVAYWLLVCGGKSDFTTKQWSPAHAADMVERLKGKVNFVQVGRDEKDTASGLIHTQFRIPGTIDLINRTSIRDLVQLVRHADGVVCPVTMMMHLAAAVPTREKRLRPAVIIAGGREDAHFTQYPGHQFLHTVGSMDCCATGGCWRYRVAALGDGSVRDNPENLCLHPLREATDGPVIAECMHRVTPQRAADAVEMYL
jgi:ADP-heptose:LPS heptosyltransferase